MKVSLNTEKWIARVCIMIFLLGFLSIMTLLAFSWRLFNAETVPEIVASVFKNWWITCLTAYVVSVVSVPFGFFAIYHHVKSKGQEYVGSSFEEDKLGIVYLMLCFMALGFIGFVLILVFLLVNFSVWISPNFHDNDNGPKNSKILRCLRSLKDLCNRVKDRVMDFWMIFSCELLGEV